LGKALRRNVPAIFGADLQRVTSLAPAEVINTLIKVLNGELRSLRIRPDLKAIATQIKQDEIGKGVQPGVAEVSIRQLVEIPIKANPEFV